MKCSLNLTVLLQENGNENLVMTFPIKRKINIELFIDISAALLLMGDRLWAQQQLSIINIKSIFDI